MDTGFAEECRSILKKIVGCTKSIRYAVPIKIYLPSPSSEEPNFGEDKSSIHRPEARNATMLERRSKTKVFAVPQPTVNHVTPPTTLRNNAGCVSSAALLPAVNVPLAMHNSSCNIPVLPLSCSTILEA